MSTIATQLFAEIKMQDEANRAHRLQVNKEEDKIEVEKKAAKKITKLGKKVEKAEKKAVKAATKVAKKAAKKNEGAYAAGPATVAAPTVQPTEAELKQRGLDHVASIVASVIDAMPTLAERNPNPAPAGTLADIPEGITAGITFAGNGTAIEHLGDISDGGTIATVTPIEGALAADTVIDHSMTRQDGDATQAPQPGVCTALGLAFSTAKRIRKHQ